MIVCRKRDPARAGSPRGANGTKFGRPCKIHDAGHITTTKKMKANGHIGKGHRQVPRCESGDLVSVFDRRGCLVQLTLRGYTDLNVIDAV